jgi:hypothetical protein
LSNRQAAEAVTLAAQAFATVKPAFRCRARFPASEDCTAIVRT